ncbi:MAG: SRPBCC family protein [Chloroflexota bacterium]|nr:SRPBCC family protein [Chloroflexota bacterium]
MTAREDPTAAALGAAAPLPAPDLIRRTPIHSDAVSDERAVPLIAASDKTVPVTVQVRSPLTPSQAFDLIVPIDLSLVFKKWGPIPGVLGASNQTGAWDSAGQSRNPDLTDGSTATERLTEYTPGHSFAYEVTDFTGPMRHVVAGVRGEWTFTPDGDGTMIRWTYEFKSIPRRFLPLRWGLIPLWRRYMRRGLGGTADAAEQIARTGP